MNENNNSQKNPLELALEAFQKGTEKIEKTRTDLEEFVEFVLDKQDEFTTQEKEFTEKTESVIKLLTNNFELYEEVAKKLHTNYKQSFQKLVEDSKVVALQLHEEDRNSLQDTSIQIKNYLKLRYFDFGVIALLIVTTIFSGYFATQFYKTSVQTKTEAREELLKQLNRNNEVIVDQNIFDALKNEKEMIKCWSKSNPNDSKSYESFRSGIISANSKLKLFENLKNQDIVGE